jgi:ADP-ribose pyrophosphatase
MLATADELAFEILDEAIVFDGFWPLKVLQLRHQRFAGGWSETMRRELHCRGEAVGVLLYDPQLDAIGIVEQFRVGAAQRPGNPWLLELVAGLLEPGETPEQVALRETLEESGCVIEALVPLASYFSSPGGSDEYFHLFCARTRLGAVRSLHGQPDEHEDIRLHVIPFREALRMQQQGRFNNAHTLIALQWLLLHHDEVRQAWS